MVEDIDADSGEITNGTGNPDLQLEYGRAKAAIRNIYPNM